MKRLSILPGYSAPLGATLYDGGANFSVYSRCATAVELLLFNEADDAEPVSVLRLSLDINRTYHYWHAFVPGIKSGQLYAYRVEIAPDTERVARFNTSQSLLDPYGRSVVVPSRYDRQSACPAGNSGSPPMKNVVVDPTKYDWQGDQPLRRPSARTIVYEMHIRGFTMNPNSGVRDAHRGTYAGVIEKIPYLRDLGITAVELLPVFHFDSQDAPPGKTNYWGYAPLSFFAPHPSYSSQSDPIGVIDEFRDMVKAFHRAGIEVILDVVYNHTAEGDERGPTLGFKGIDSSTYYLFSGGKFCNYSGCGNTLNTNHPVVRRMILDSLKYWVQEMHVDGFRFDLASILTRDSSGHPQANPALIWDIESEPALAGTKLIAEAWDAAGLYQVGHFVGDAWKEWNGRFRDDVRDFMRGEPGSVRKVADRIVGSPQVYEHKNREAEQSVNFVTCHDGFSLNDLVSYNHKHNEANGEANRDGGDDNRSWNCGAEGPTDNPEVERLRNRQVKNFLAVNLLSLGVPMLLMGDEVRRTQFGNNNSYCQDNELSWFDWSLVEKHTDVLRFVRLLCHRRVARDSEHERRRISLSQMLREANETWHGVELRKPDWSDHAKSVALNGSLPREGLHFHLILNAHHEPLEFELPALFNSSWRRWLDTALASPDDICRWDASPEHHDPTYHMEEHSVVMLIAFDKPTTSRDGNDSNSSTRA